MNTTINQKSFVNYLFLICLVTFSPSILSGEVLSQLPEEISPSSKYVFFLHGRIVEKGGVESAKSSDYGFYEYNKILNELAKHDFIVISEVRSEDTKIKRYAKKIASQVNELIEKGVAPKNITVSGFSKGGKITLVTSSLVRNESVNYVVLAGCIRKAKKFIKKFDLDLKGRVLSIVDYNDDTFSSCERMFDSASGGLEHKEIILEDGSGHGVFYTPKDKWIKPMIDWIK